VNYCRSGGTALTLLLGIVLALSGSLATLADVPNEEAILEVVESFHQLALVDPDAAGAVWMSDAAYPVWHDIIGELTDQTTGSSLWFVHTLSLAEVGDNGVPYGGLYSPWLGVLLVFELDEDVSVVADFSLQLATEPLRSASDPMELAEALMASIRQGAAAFEQTLGTLASTEVDEDVRSTVVARITDYTESLRPTYANGSPAGQAVEVILNRMVAGRFAGPLSLLKNEDERWIATLIPVWLDSNAGRTFVALGSSYVPLDMVWLEIDDTANADVASVSLIRLFNQVTTRGGEGA
jgi:hypothetical protein